MKKMIVALLTLCMVAVVVPPVSGGDDGENAGISTHEYSLQYEDN